MNQFKIDIKSNRMTEPVITTGQRATLSELTYLLNDDKVKSIVITKLP